MRKVIVSLVLALVIFLPSFGQESDDLQEIFLEGEYFRMNEDFTDALADYLKVYEKLPDNQNIAYCIGICYLNIQGKKNLSVDYLETAARNVSALHKEGTILQTSAPYEALYELGRAYRINFMFEKAKEAFTKYMGTLLPDDRENIAFLKHEIEICDMAPSFMAKPVSFTEENAGQVFNDEKANFNPVISADGRTFAFMVSLKFYDAVMISRLSGGKWSPPLNISPELQTDGDLNISGLSADGSTLYLSLNDNRNSDIYSSSFNGNIWSKSVKLNRNINTRYWESHGFVSESGRQLIFASDRPGGFGGLDLYISTKINGEWGPAVNLGPEINTPFNEDRPFFCNDDKTLYFSSQGHSGLGGYDLFRSGLLANGLWSKPENLGYPINTPDDNSFFMPLSDGKSGYYALPRSTGGFGREDIYKITFK